ncbi:VanZ family protein [Paenibacillus sp. MSJ-34]|uniref:VanZ family protein n=1 Tax=Paenibacillus sp. MSJ-34 TaxID=2841529 RepID=UPI001C128BAD|nr:VanZ family protein [Paenibacillus sp. MSJ-34]MBU5440696.1 VanZ family protein [Paenibacillus sp. MSJ-34]
MKWIKKRFLIWLALTAICMAVIFIKSAEPYVEQDLRPALAAWIPQAIVDHLPHIEFYYDGGLVTSAKPYDFIEFWIRKAAHVTEFAVLTFLWMKTLLALPIREGTAIGTGALLSLLYAASDEWHQSFVPGRTGHAIDVAVDAVGVLIMTIAFVLATAYRKRRGARQSNVK